MWKKKIIKKGKGRIQVTKSKADRTYKSVLYKSRLEAQMAQALDMYGLPINYETKTFTIFKSQPNYITFYRKQINNKGDYKSRDNTIRSIKYTPDFFDDNFLKKDNAFIIECKGNPDSVFQLRFNLFMRFCNKYHKNFVLYMPRNKTQCLQTAKMIADSRKNNNSK